jgi:hypothetical protein
MHQSAPCHLDSVPSACTFGISALGVGQCGPVASLVAEEKFVPRIQVVPPLTSAIGRFHTWWRGDPLPSLPFLSGLVMVPTDDQPLLNTLAGIDAAEFQRRMRQGHQPWLARIGVEPVAWGWCAAESLSIGELGIDCPLPRGNRYLWDFCTVTRWRGHGIYPRLLQTIVTSETEATRFWVGHDVPNVASERGIAKAGFQEVGVLYRQPDGGFELVPSASPQRVNAASALFGIPIAGRCSARIA